ncbi:lipocalin family protein [Flavobacterium psychrotrophum]|uniref:lipocalin family protein n=1 Tax=Flavobacterium psychrotrophum TaxID=2294119 RepID=UPI000E30BB7C|nr:lipocalin family protein [Flavobacterium psychrotrophum]
MKKLALLCLLTGFAACSDDSSSTSIDTNHLTGRKWYVDAYKYAGNTIPQPDDACSRDYLEFFTNGTVNFTEVYNCEDYTDYYTYDLDGNTITRTAENGTVSTGTIKQLTASRLVIENNTDIDEDGTPEAVQTIYTTN